MYKRQVHTELKFTYADATKRCSSLPDLHKVRNAIASESRQARVNNWLALIAAGALQCRASLNLNVLVGVGGVI